MLLNSLLALAMLINIGFLSHVIAGEECHCQSQSCPPSGPDSGGACRYGCQNGWMGDKCDQVKRDPEIIFQCIAPRFGRQEMNVIIKTHGVLYRGISLVDENKVEKDLCWETEIVGRHEVVEVMTIKATLTYRALRQIGDDSCGVKTLADNVYQWLFVISEWEGGINLGIEKNINVTCNFNQAETFSRSVFVEPTDERRIEFEQLEQSDEGVELSVLDAITREPVTTASSGSPVVLQIGYGGLIKSLSPFNCYASSVNETRGKQLIDSNGCPSTGSPVKPFAKSNDTAKAVETPWFPYFSFDGSPKTKFKCSFKLCYDDSCLVGCKYPRHVRSVDSFLERVVKSN